MNEKLRVQTDNAEEYDWLLRIVEFLRSVIGYPVSKVECIAIIQILTRRRIRLKDGFLINEDADLNRKIWLVDAAVIASVLCTDPDQLGTWWKQEYSAYPKETREYDEVVSRILESIKRSPKVEAVD